MKRYQKICLVVGLILALGAALWWLSTSSLELPEEAVSVQVQSRYSQESRTLTDPETIAYILEELDAMILYDALAQEIPPDKGYEMILTDQAGRSYPILFLDSSTLQTDSGLYHANVRIYYQFDSMVSKDNFKPSYFNGFTGPLILVSLLGMAVILGLAVGLVLMIQTFVCEGAKDPRRHWIPMAVLAVYSLVELVVPMVSGLLYLLCMGMVIVLEQSPLFYDLHYPQTFIGWVLLFPALFVTQFLVIRNHRREAGPHEEALD